MPNSSEASSIDTETLARIQQGFERSLPCILPAWQAFRLRGLTGERKEEAIAETLALCWQAYLTLSRQGRDPESLAPKIAEFATRRVRSGRGLTNSNPVPDVLSSTSQFRRDYVLESIPLSADDDSDPDLIDALVDGKINPADEAAFRIDSSAFLAGLDARKREIAEQLVAGWNNAEVAQRHGVSRMRIYQLRMEMAEAWRHFFGEEGTPSTQRHGER